MKQTLHSIRFVFMLGVALLMVQESFGNGRPFYEAVEPDGQHDDGQTSIFYDPATGELAVDAPRSVDLTSINIDSSNGVFTGEPAKFLGGSFDNHSPWNIFKATFGSSFGSASFGNVAQTGLSYDFVLEDLSVVGSLSGGGILGEVDLIYAGPVIPVLLPGDANEDWSFDQQDLVQVLTADKYVSGRPATWGEGDWNGGPGGEPGNPPAGNGLFDEFDIMAALGRDAYGTGTYNAIGADGHTTETGVAVVYDARSGQVSVDSRSGQGLSSIHIDSSAGIFTASPAEGLTGAFDSDTDNTIFKATFGASFGSLSFGNVASTGHSEEFVLDDLMVTGTLAGGGELDHVELLYVPEPSSVLLLATGLVIGLGCFQRSLVSEISA